MTTNSTSPPPANATDDKIPSIIGCAVTSMMLCLLLYVFRIVSRRISRTPLMASDYFLFGGVIACYGIGVLDIWGDASRATPKIALPY